MIQRIQTLYLLIVLVAMSLTLSLPSMRAISPEGIDFAFSNLRGLYQVEQGGFNITGVTMWLLFTNIIILVISLITIFTYRWRVIQMRLSSFNMVLLVGYYAIFFFTRYVKIIIIRCFSNLFSLGNYLIIIGCKCSISFRNTKEFKLF